MSKLEEPKTEKREAILEAMLGLVVERGFHNAPMSLLAKRAGASPGIIYHYFNSKDDVIRALYEKIRHAKRDALLAGYSRDARARETFFRIWLNAYEFYRSHMAETRFLDQYLHSPYCAGANGSEANEGEADTVQLLALFRPKKKGGILKDLPPEAMNSLTFGLAASLAKSPKSFSEKTLKNIAGSVWTAIVEE